jgi:hypothetical protein
LPFFDHLVGKREQRGWDFEAAERLGGFDIDQRRRIG